MKRSLLLMTLILPALALAGRPTPKGETMARVHAVMEKAAIADFILSVREIGQLHYVMETRRLDETGCRADGYRVELTSRDPRTAAPTYVAKPDGERRVCLD